MSGERGVLVAVEGIERSGKSTLACGLLKRLGAGACVGVRFDAASANARDIYQRAKGEPTDMGDRFLEPVCESCGSAHAPLLERVRELMRVRAPLLDSDDRYELASLDRWQRAMFVHRMLRAGTHVVLDSYAYSSLARAAAAPASAGIDWYMGFDRGLPKPDLVIYLDRAPAPGSVEQARAKHIFEQELFEQDSWVTINAAQPAEQVLEQAYPEVLKRIARPRGPVRPLWDDE